MRTFVGFDVGGTTVKYGLITEEGNILNRGVFKTPMAAAENVEKMAAVVQNYQTECDINGVGIDAPGIVRQDGFMITGGAVKGFFQFPLRATLEERLSLPVRVENDANAAAIAERWLGNAKDVDDYICLVLGTGIGGGLVLKGEVYRGAHGMAGEIGWSITHNLGAAEDLETISLNQSASVVNGLVRRYNLALKQVSPNAPDEERAEIIIDQAKMNDAISLKVYQQFLVDVAIMLMNLIGTIDPERILVGGGISRNEIFMHDLNQTFDELVGKHEALSGGRKNFQYKIMPAGLHNDAGMMGAVYPLITGC